MDENRSGRKKIIHSVSGDYDPDNELQEIDKENKIVSESFAIASGSKSLEDFLKLADIIRGVGQYVLFSYDSDIYSGLIMGFNDNE